MPPHFSPTGHLAGILDREHSEPDQVRDAEPVVQAEGREGHGEVREGQEAQGQDRQDQRGLHFRYISPPVLNAIKLFSVGNLEVGISPKISNCFQIIKRSRLRLQFH